MSTSKISNVYIQANAENDRTIQKIINLERNRKNAIIARLPPPLGGKSLRPSKLVKTDLFYLDNRLLVPRDMRENVLRVIHF